MTIDTERPARMGEVHIHITPPTWRWGCRDTAMVTIQIASSIFSLALVYQASSYKSDLTSWAVLIGVGGGMQLIQVVTSHLVPRIWGDM